MSRALTLDELLFIVHVQHDTIMSLLEQVADTRRQVTEAYHYGRTDGEWTGQMRGAELAERDMAEHWASIVRDVRAQIGQPSFAERRTRELEWVKPRPGDYTGRLSAVEYFGTVSAQQDAAMKWRAA